MKKLSKVDLKSWLVVAASTSVLLTTFQNCAGGLPDLGNAQSSASTCRSGFWSIGDGRLCMEKQMRFANSINGYNTSANAATTNAIHVCKLAGPGAHVCTHTEFQEACGARAAAGQPDVDPYSGQNLGVYGDHASIYTGQTVGNPSNIPVGATDDIYLTWNVAACADNNDGPGRHEAEVSLFYFRCCY